MTENWNQILTDIYNFALTNPTTGEEIENWVATYHRVNKLDFSSLLASLGGFDRNKLLKLSKGIGSSQLKTGKGEFSHYQNWTSLDSSKDGNCFLNSFSIYLVGNESLAIQLRVLICLFLMSNLEYVDIVGTKSKIASLVDKLTINEHDGTNYPLAKNKSWLMTSDVKYISLILSRPIRVIYSPIATMFTNSKAYKFFVEKTGGWASLDYIDPDIDYDHEEIWTICHVSGNHFEPLISPIPELIEPKTPLNNAFRILNLTIDSVLRGDVAYSDYLDSGEFKSKLDDLDRETHKEEIKEKIRAILTKLGDWNLAQPNIRNIIDQLKTILNPYLDEDDVKDNISNPPPPPSLEETLITQILTVLDTWKDSLDSFFTSEAKEKEDVRQVIKKLADNQGNRLEQYKAVINLLTKYPSFSDVRLTEYLSQWKNQLISEEPKTEPKLEDDEDENIIPSWLFGDELEPKPAPKPKTPKPISLKRLATRTGPHISCLICEKRKFYSKAEFIQAHGINRLEPSIWVYTTTQPNKQEPVFWYRWLCKACKQEQHTVKCKYYSPPPKPVIPPKIFDWKEYWKWWFGVLTLDWNSKRFFDKYE